MPSGAKKRKAAKKKKEKESQITSSTNNPQGYDDVKSQDEKGSDGGEVNSPSNEDNHNHHHPFSEAKEELGQKDSSSVPSVDVEDKSLETASSGMKGTQKVVQDDGLIEIERDVKSEEPSDGKGSNVEYIESAKELHYGGDKSSSSSSSSDDEFQEFKKKPSNQASNLGPDATSHNEWVKSVEPSSTNVAQITENGAPNGKSTKPVTDLSPVVESEKPVVPVVETDSVLENAPIETSLVSDVIESGLENGAAKSSTSGVPVLSSTKIESKVIPLTDENAKASSAMSEPRRIESESESLSNSGALFGQAVNDAERNREFEIPESSENQPLVAPTPQLVHKTSWLSCCGIFDGLTGSSR